VDAFYERVDEGEFASQVHTRGPWDADAQHAGPPASLLGGAMQAAVDGQMLARVTFEILRPVPIARLRVDAEVVRPGRRVALVEGTLSDPNGPVMLARGWMVRTADIDLPAEVALADDPAPGPEDGSVEPFFDVGWDEGYHRAMDVRFLAGGFTRPGPAWAWMRPRIPIVAGDDVTPLQRVLVGADSGNGLSAALPVGTWLFVNTDLTVHLHAEPTGDWVGFDAVTTLEPHGVGLATTTIHDRDGSVGRGLQTLLVAPAG
jgi:acyl-coenzyme A thioesterase PaaI-like protein